MYTLTEGLWFHLLLFCSTETSISGVELQHKTFGGQMIEMLWCQKEECFQKLTCTAVAVPLQPTGSCGGHLENKRRSQLRKKLDVHLLTQQSHFGSCLDTAGLVRATVWLFRSLILACQFRQCNKRWQTVWLCPVNHLSPVDSVGASAPVTNLSRPSAVVLCKSAGRNAALCVASCFSAAFKHLALIPCFILSRG